MGSFCLLVALMSPFLKIVYIMHLYQTMEGEKEAEREQQDLLGCHQGADGSQMDWPCLLFRTRRIPHHTSAQASGFAQSPVCSSKDTLMGKELPFLGSLLLDALIFLAGVFCEH